MIQFKNLKFTYSNHTQASLILDDIVINQGECVVLCGKSGSGKTSITRLINGLIPEYYEGRLEGLCDISGYTPGIDSIEIIAKEVGSVFQNPATQFFHKIVEHELVFPCENQGMSLSDIQRQLENTVNFFRIDYLLDRDLQSASGGEQQRIAVATAMMQNPKIIVFDEPTANLDAMGMEQIALYISQLKQKGITVIIAEHRLDFLKDVADKYVYVDQGRIHTQWNREQWLELSNIDRAQLGLRSIHLKKLERHNPTESKQGLCLNNVVIRHGKNQLGTIPHVTFPPNTITALVGKNGIGKSSLAHIIAGLKKAEGTVDYNGEIVEQKDRIKHTAFVMQDVRLQLFSESVEKEIQLGAENKENKEMIIKQLGLEKLLEQHPMCLSGGEQQRVIIANALLSDKKVFIFDEPTSGLDYIQMIHFAQLLQTLKNENRVIIVITHDVELIESACDNIIHFEDIIT